MQSQFILLIIFLLLNVLYVPLNRRSARYYWKSSYDAFIPFVSIFVIPYVALFPFMAMAIWLLWLSPLGVSLLASGIVAQILAMVFWYVFPNGVKRPKITTDTHLHKMLSIIYRYDGDTNGFPSSHVFFSFIGAYFLTLGYPAYALPIWLVGFLIALSTVFTKQHYVLDVFGGVIVFVLSCFATHFVGLPVFL